MEFIKIILTSVGSIIALFFSTKIIGNKQMSELSTRRKNYPDNVRMPFIFLKRSKLRIEIGRAHV